TKYINSRVENQEAKSRDEFQAALESTKSALKSQWEQAIVAASQGNKAAVEQLESQLVKQFETQLRTAIDSSSKSWARELDSLRSQLGGGNLAESLSEQVRQKIMDEVTNDATKAAIVASENAGKATLEATIAASEKAAKTISAETAKKF